MSWLHHALFPPLWDSVPPLESTPMGGGPFPPLSEIWKENPALLRRPCDSLKKYLKYFWNPKNTIEIYLKYTWNTPKTPLRHRWDITLEPSLRDLCNSLETSGENLGAWSNARRNIFVFYSLKINIETAKRRTNIDGVTDTRGGGRNLTIRHFLDNMEHFNYNLLYLYIY